MTLVIADNAPLKAFNSFGVTAHARRLVHLTDARDLDRALDALCHEPARLVLGGPMMGHEIPNLHIPMIKGSSGVLALTQKEIGLTVPAPCIRCSTCVGACPVGLLPLEMAAHIRATDPKKPPTPTNAIAPACFITRYSPKTPGRKASA